MTLEPWLSFICCICATKIKLSSSPALQMKCSTRLNEAICWSLGFMKWIPRWQNLHLVRTSQTHRTCMGVPSLTWKAFTCGTVTNPSSNKYTLMWQYPVKSPVTCLSWFLFSCISAIVVLTEHSERKSVTCFSPGVDICYMHIFC
jgi:hypothetical protein